MNKIDLLFKEKQNNILSIYFTAGFPKLNDTTEILKELENNAVDMIEIGMPFSDPLADGPTIQHASEVALENGMSIKLLFEHLTKANIKDSKCAMLLMGYLNPILQYGVEKFCKDAAHLGIAGIIVPDLPLQEYINDYKSIFEKYGLKNIFLITPQTTDERIKLIDGYSNGFIYMVSSSSTTGAKNKIETSQEDYFKRIKAMQLKNKLIIGFGISDNKTFSKACEYANGAIIGSAFVKAIDDPTSIKKDVKIFIQNVLKESIVQK
ncbi:MAG: tryptophan synthase subunit alpha [Bacteroidia bacterium]